MRLSGTGSGRPRPLVLFLVVVLVGVGGGLGVRFLRDLRQPGLLPVRVVFTSSSAEISVEGKREGGCVEVAALGECLPVVRVMQEPDKPLRALSLTGVVSPGITLLYWGCREGAGVPVCTPAPQQGDDVVCATTSSESDLTASAACMELSGAAGIRNPGAGTQVVQFAPVTRDGAPAAGYHVTDLSAEHRADRCSPAFSATAPDIVSCLPFTLGAQACWIEADRTKLLCGTPGSNRLFRYGARKALATTNPPSEERRNPLLIELRDGARCTARWGGGGPHPLLPDQLTARYHCGGRGIVVQGPDDPLMSRTEPYWTVRVIDLASGDGAAAQPHEVASVYYAGRP
ncbi:hypothetical protein [Micromonospora sp. KC213]|uniref:hypothetical protein n=1 Tax=Micromonospora sp. KC213 TaxID=2530378 RepID=UPI001050778C|nr:hypothetical protein [Micromonospora sp. KC213]TDC41404.1 hypothetical protein E1166_11815 [Micromonospora sp. KC213]